MARMPRKTRVFGSRPVARLLGRLRLACLARFDSGPYSGFAAWVGVEVPRQCAAALQRQQRGEDDDGDDQRGAVHYVGLAD